MNEHGANQLSMHSCHTWYERSLMFRALLRAGLQILGVLQPVFSVSFVQVLDKSGV